MIAVIRDHNLFPRRVFSKKLFALLFVCTVNKRLVSTVF